MFAVILAAGYGTRMGDLTVTTPKPLLKYAGKTLLEHKFDALPDKITDIVLVVGYLGEQIEKAFGNSYKGRPIHYVWQKERKGTAHALWQAQELLKTKSDSFVVLNGDDIYDDMDIKHLSEEKFAVLVDEIEEDMKVGKCIVDENGHLTKIIEDPVGNMKGAVNTGASVLPLSVFEEEMVLLPNGKEYGLPQTFAQRASKEKIKLIPARKWIRVTAPEDLE